jgi:hypothetical protein
MNDPLGDVIKPYKAAEQTKTTLADRGGTNESSSRKFEFKDALFKPVYNSDEKFLGFNVYDKQSSSGEPILQMDNKEDVKDFLDNYNVIMGGARMFANSSPAQQKTVTGVLFGGGGKMYREGLMEEHKDYWSDPVNVVTTVVMSVHAGIKATSPRPAPKTYINSLSDKISVQKQSRHLMGTAKSGGGYMVSVQDAQTVLNAVHTGQASFMGFTKAGHVVFKYKPIIGYNVNLGQGIMNQSTNLFMIKGTTSPSVVPISPFWKP